MKLTAKFWITIAALIILSPAGKIIPKYFNTKDAWEGAQARNAPLAYYTLKGWEEKGLLHQGFAYMVSALIGVVIVVIVIFLIAKKLSKKEDKP